MYPQIVLGRGAVETLLSGSERIINQIMGSDMRCSATIRQISLNTRILKRFTATMTGRVLQQADKKCLRDREADASQEKGDERLDRLKRI